ncbi:hypothetical protein WKW77_33620 [Variovorax ureilyticus]|uniref:Uncharacterized protein n=1 Tax=Variovorax ureilyticus TaxID=1836198 RepID=A0ABU8VQU9_9BURK
MERDNEAIPGEAIGNPNQEVIKRFGEPTGKDEPTWTKAAVVVTIMLVLAVSFLRFAGLIT